MSHYRLLFPSEYLNACDLKGKEATVTIESISVEEVPDPQGKKQRKPVLTFAGKHKRLVLNRTNANRIAAQHGKDTDLWLGKSVTLYPTECQAFGQQVECVRIR